MILTPTQEDIINSFIANIQSTIPEASTTPSSSIREAFINPAASQLSSLFDISKRIAVLQDIFNATGSDLDLLAQSYGLFRRGGVPASGTLYLDLTALLNASSINVGNGSSVRTRGTGSQSATFIVIGSYTFTSADRAIYEATASNIRSQLDSVGFTNVRLASAVPVQATSSGTQGNLGAFTLTSSNISGITNVINISPTSGGSDSESDDSLRNRLVSLFTGNSVGTVAGLLSAAAKPSYITGTFAIRYGDPLMTRDGSVYDSEGNLITPGTGRAVDIYVQGSSLSSTSAQYQFTLQNTNSFLSFDNSILIGQPTSASLFGTLPISNVNQIQGVESATTFTQGVPVQDEDGNILIEGNFALISDVEANKYFIVENLTTRERKLAKYINPSSTKYTIVETISPSGFANSPFSQDKILFLKNKVTILEESVTKGIYNGANQLNYSNVTSISSVYEDKNIVETIKIETFTEVAGGIAITLKHTPITSINSIYHARLGINIDFEILDPLTGLVKLISRAPPRAGDLLNIDYVWKQTYKEDLNYSLAGDLVDWVSFADEKGRSNNVLLEAVDLQSQNLLSLQPSVSSFLQLSLSGIPDREVVEIKIEGTSAEIKLDQQAIKNPTPYSFSIVGSSNVGRIFKVSNISKTLDYNLAGYKLKINKFDSRAGVDSSLLPQQFLLSDKANENVVQVGDRLVLSKASRTLAWSSQSDFENNIEENITPIYDPTKVEFTPGGLILKNPLLDTTTTPIVFGGSIDTDITFSGIVEITSDLIINEGVVVDFEPSTIVKIRPSNQLSSEVTYIQLTTFDGYLVQEDSIGTKDAYSDVYSAPLSTTYSEYYYLYFQPLNLNSNFYTILNDVGQTLSIRFDVDVLKKVIENSNITFYVSGRKVDESFNFELETTIDLPSTNTSIKASLIGALSGVGGSPKFTSAFVASKNQYYVLLNKTPVTTNSAQQDFTLSATYDTSVFFNRFSYNQTINALVVEGTILALDGYGDQTTATDYDVSYTIEERSKIAIIVEGTLRILGATEETSVLFTSASSDAAAGDWEGIIFTAKSHTSNPRTVFQSDLNNARIRFANVGVNIQSSDANIQTCVIRDCLNSGINISSKNQSIAEYTKDDFDLAGVTDTFEKFSSVSRLGFTTADNLQLARYPIEDNMVTNNGRLPPLGTKLSETSYIVDFVEGKDYYVFIEGQRALSIDADIPTDGYADHSLIANQDFMIEYDIHTGYSLVFLYTASSSKLRRVYNLINDLISRSPPDFRVGKITINYFSSQTNGLIYNNLIYNTNTGIIATALATTSMNKNTIDSVNIGISSSQTIASIKNNLITNYTSSALSLENESLIKVQRNDMYSQKLIDQESISILDIDLLMQTISTSTSTLLVRTPAKFKAGMFIEIDSEKMLVQGINQGSITVSRGQDNTSTATHQSGSRITLYQLNQIITVTGVLGDYCTLLETDLAGTIVPSSVPIEMRVVAPSTFKAVFPINRRADFFYKYNYGFKSSPIVLTSKVRVFAKTQIGTGVNDVINILHEVSLYSANFVPNIENYSANPLYINSSSADFSYSALLSPASSQNPMYGSLVLPNPNHRYVGFIDVETSKTLGVSDTRIPVPYIPLIVSNYGEVIVTGSDSLTTGQSLSTKEFSFNITTQEADQGAIGVFILDDTVHPSGVAIAGEYLIKYVTPTDLGSSISPYYIKSTVSYVVEVLSEVTFEKLEFNKDDQGGEVSFSFKVGQETSDLPLLATSLSQSTSPISIDQVATTNIGKVIQIDATLKGNDSSYNANLTYKFPILEDFSLNYLPAKDTLEYKVLSVIKNQVQNETNLLLDRPISVDTFSVVGSDPTLELFLRKRVDNFDPTKEILISTTQGVSVGDTYVKAFGDISSVKPAPASSDNIRVDYLSFEEGNVESLYFTQDESQVTKNMYSNINSINASITRDQKIVIPSTEQISVEELNQPATSVEYKASYYFEAPLVGESLLVAHTFNDAIRLSSQEVEASKSIFTDVLVKQVTTVPIRIALTLTVQPLASASAVRSQVSSAIANLFATTFADIQEERRLDASDIVRATGDIAGIEDIVVTTLSRNLITGEVQDPLIVEVRESPILEESSPRIATIQNGKTVSSGNI